MTAPSKSTLAHLLLLATALVWGATFVLVKSALSDVSPLLFNLLRMTIATVTLVALHHRQLGSVTRAQLKTGLLAGFFLAAGYQFQTSGLALTTPAKSAFITGMVVVFVPALTLNRALRPPGSQRPGVFAGVGALSAFAGLVLLTTPAGTGFRTIFASVGLGDLLTLACALAFAAHLLTLAHTARGLPANLLATLQIGAATLFMLLSLPLEHPHAIFSARLVAALVVCGTLATAAAFTIQTFAQQHLPATHTVLLLALEPVFAWLTSMLFLHEALGRRSLMGALLILAGIAVIEFLPATTQTTEIPA